MTIKEIEELSGMTRANIRFYEAEGLLNPQRSSNGYRDYSQEELAVLKKIKLLRSLHISLEEIKALHTGEQELSVALEKHIEKLTLERQELNKAQDVCETMRRDGVRYQTLDAGKYLNAMAKITEEPIAELGQDIIPKVQSPWRRYFARSLDIALYSAIWSCFLAIAYGVNLSNRSAGGILLDACVTLLMMLLLEPLQLFLFGTTLGKWILGLRVTDCEDGRLKFSQALERTWQVFVYGMGLNIPIYYLYRSFKSYEDCVTGVTLEWEYSSNLALRDKKIWRTVVYVGARVAIAGVLASAAVTAQIPPNRGSLTVEQFCENYRYLEKYYDMEAAYDRKLNNLGQWVEDSRNGVVTGQVIESAYPSRMDFIFDVDEKGEISVVRFGMEISDSKKAIPCYRHQMQLAVLAFVGAQEEFRQFSGDRGEIVELIAANDFGDFSFSRAGVNVTCEVEYKGYENPMPMGYLWPEEGLEQQFSLQFAMEKD